MTTPAHPRSRGENSSVTGSPAPYTGSSPLTRGKRCRVVLRSTRTGLIPAHAGKTHGQYFGSSGVPAHPRSRGENYMQRSAVGDTPGSSPLTRGKLLGVTLLPWQERLIPAHAGKTCSLTIRRCSAAAHPRSRGENAFRITTCTPAPGSSPLTRGKLPELHGLAPERRLIPAHAGKTRLLRVSARPGWAHPRSRGENYGRY